MRLPIPPPGQVRKAAQCTHGVGDCQLTASRGKFGRRRSGGSSAKPRGAAPAARRSAGGAARTKERTHATPGKAVSGAHVKPGSVVEGTVSANRAGYGFLRVDGFKDSVFLPPPEMRGVMHGDRLRVKVSRDATERWSGTVQEVVGRGVTAFLGTVEVQGRSAWVNAADRRLQLRCAVAPADLNGAHGGDWVIARIRATRAPPHRRRPSSSSGWTLTGRWTLRLNRRSRALTCRTVLGRGAARGARLWFGSGSGHGGGARGPARPAARDHRWRGCA